MQQLRFLMTFLCVGFVLFCEPVYSASSSPDVRYVVSYEPTIPAKSIRDFRVQLLISRDSRIFLLICKGKRECEGPMPREGVALAKFLEKIETGYSRDFYRSLIVNGATKLPFLIAAISLVEAYFLDSSRLTTATAICLGSPVALLAYHGSPNKYLGFCTRRFEQLIRMANEDPERYGAVHIRTADIAGLADRLRAIFIEIAEQ